MNTQSSRRSRPPRGQHALALALAAAVSLSACGGAEDDDDQRANTSDAAASAPSPSPTPASGEQHAPADGIPIRISFGDTELTGRLLDDPTDRI